MRTLLLIIAALEFGRLGTQAALIDGSAPGQVDLSFDLGSMHEPNGNVRALASLPDGGVILGGYFTKVGAVEQTYLARLKADGTLDAAFDAKIGAGQNYFVYALKVQPDGKILVAGRFSSIAGRAKASLARLNPDGTLDPNFVTSVTSGGPFPNVYALALQPDGRILVGGNFGLVNGESRNGIARLNADGTVDRNFRPMSGTGPAENYVVYAVALQSDQRLLIGGRFSSVNAVKRSHIARLHK